ncbi:G/U mismatch-specific DNA glycosylase [Pseudonocardia sp. GCM10023141]|uniref:G/U mismatch-specific DNA glycosylase n=1 Tax=Pseudonocardia sp. GCM10023141 TaxID=3252653 RepID=UPI00361B1C1E
MPPRTRHTATELAPAGASTLPDLIADDLCVLIAGINPGLSSAAGGRHFGNPGNRLWPALFRAGFTPRLLDAGEAPELLALGIGITSIVSRPTVRAAELTRAEFVAGGAALRGRVLARRPRWLALLGVTGYRAAFAAPGAQVGLQPESIGATRIWVLPNPSGLNAHYPPAALAREFTRLREATGLPDRSAGTRPA